MEHEVKKDNDEIGGIWTLIMCDGTRGYLGRVKGHKKLDDKVRTQLQSQNTIILDIVFDYFSPLRQIMQPGPNGQPVPAMAREPIVTGFEFTIEKCDVAVRWMSLTFLDDMHPKDRISYMEFAKVSIRKNLELRVEAAGLVMADAAAHAKPGEPPHVHLDLRPMNKQ